MLIFPVKLYNVKENEKSMYLFIYPMINLKIEPIYSRENVVCLFTLLGSLIFY